MGFVLWGLFIADNGSGVNKILSGQMHQSKGLTLVKERLNLLNKSYTNSFQIKSKLGIEKSITLQLETPNYND
jgi:two-component sensor histidine kinase